MERIDNLIGIVLRSAVTELYVRERGHVFTKIDPDTLKGSDLNINYPSIWDWSMVTGAHQIEIKLNWNSYDGVQTCQDFTETEKVQGQIIV